ncbi:hypothetical protein [Arthrobacter sp. G119Y2]|uniref:hypothetical protein n=1 Tax=Arthrobacter sp. G119Y2 TaxID=3134965 RepID=UPI0031198FA8
MLTDASVQGQQRILRIGLRERMVLDLVNGSRTVSEISEELAGQGMPLPPQAVAGVLHKLMMFGMIDRPFTVAAAAVDVLDSRAHIGSTTRTGVWAPAANGFSRFAPTRWSIDALTTTPVLGIALALAVASAVVMVIAAPSVLLTVVHPQSAAWFVTAFLVAIVWNIGVTVVHEAAHVGTFRALAGRPAHLSITRFGIIPMLNTQLDGLGLLSRSRRARVVAVGPIVSLCLALVPLSLFFFAPEGSFLRYISGAAVLVDLIVIALAVSFFPNTDGTRFLEVLSSVDQLQSVAFLTLLRRRKLPRGLPRFTRILVRVYPVLLAGTVISFLLASVWAIRLALL